VNLFLLVVLSLPMLMLTRLLGGVEWITILAGICITLTAGIFAAAITMFFSTITRKAWSCILCTLLTLGALYFLLPYLFFLLVDTADHGFAKRFFDSRSGATLSFIIHPYAALIIVVFTPISAPGKFAGIYKLWPAHCAYMLFVSLMILLWCAKRIRNVTAGRAIGSKFIDQEAVPVNANLITTSQSPTSIALPIKKTHASRINWHPMFRKELGKGLFRSGKTATLVLSGLLLLAGAFYLLLTAQRHGPDDFELNTMFTEVFLGLGALTLCIVASTVVSSERQSRTLELLLLTNISPGTIILSKCLGAIRKSLCIWVFLLGYVLIVVGSEQLHPIAILHVFMLAVSITILLTGSGIFFSTYFRTTSTAVILNLAFCLVLWVLVPLIAIIMMRRYESSHLAASHPFVLLASAIEGSSERGNYYWRGHVPGERYYFPGGQEISMAYMTWHVMVIMLWHCLAGFAMAALAASGLRNRAR
ncbi:MAG TPA: hypothetical protein ENL03_03970, partial [Phycisphaerae bacterium]|nr:hypothetical protein [Phycisphaerae bacterium]